MSDLVRIVSRAAAILDVLTTEPISVRRLAAEARVPRSTAQDYLVALEAAGRAERVEGGWVLPTVDSLFAPEHKDSTQRPAVPDASSDSEARWAA